MKTELKTEETDVMDPETIRKLQKMDKTLESIRIQETKQYKDDDIQILYKDDIMYRQVFRKECTEPIKQLVLPEPCRQKVLEVSHDIPLAGHLGRKKTLQRIKRRF